MYQKIHLYFLAADGIVTHVRDDSNLGGSEVFYWNHTNFVVIMHKNGEYSGYDHLAYRSSKVEVGQHVSACQEIARVGMTGYTFIPHLHFPGICSLRGLISGLITQQWKLKILLVDDLIFSRQNLDTMTI